MNRINAQVNNIFEKGRKNYLPGLLLPKIFQHREKTRPNTCLFAMKIRINRYKAPTSLAILVVLLIIGFFCDCSDAASGSKSKRDFRRFIQKQIQ